MREQVEDILGRGRTEPPEHIPYTPRARRVLDLAQREARHMGHGRVGTEHLLLGLLREGRNVAAQTVTQLGGDLSRVRQQVFQLAGQRPRRRRLTRIQLGLTARRLTSSCD